MSEAANQGGTFFDPPTEQESLAAACERLGQELEEERRRVDAMKRAADVIVRSGKRGIAIIEIDHGLAERLRVRLRRDYEPSKLVARLEEVLEEYAYEREAHEARLGMIEAAERAIEG